VTEDEAISIKTTVATMKIGSPLLLCACFSPFTAVLGHNGEAHAYYAVLEPLPDAEGTDYQTGEAVVFIPAGFYEAGMVGYAGMVTGVESDLAAEDCTEPNACGAHIHEGLGCNGTEAQVSPFEHRFDSYDDRVG